MLFDMATKLTWRPATRCQTATRCAPIPPLGHQAGALQHGYVFLYSCKGHAIARGQLADGRRPSRERAYRGA